MGNRVKEILRRGEASHGVWLEWLDPDVIEVIGLVGFDYVMIDGEHTALDRVSSTELIRACDVVGITPIVRVREGLNSEILGYLELGAQGIYVPHVNSGAEAKAIVDAVKYAPMGHRGAGSARGVRYGLTQDPRDYLRQANDDTMVIALVEEPSGVTNLDQILAVPGIDVVGIGDGDLSHLMGHPGDRGHPDVRQVVDDAEARIVAAGKVFDSVVSSRAEALEALGRGSRMISLALQTSVVELLRGYLRDLREPAAVS
jgi:4-hydroxy-2-oxoheptanedioate aldolase